MGSEPDQTKRNRVGGPRPGVGRKKGAGTGLNDWFIGIFGLAFLLSLSLNVMHLTMSDHHEETNDIGGRGHSTNQRAARAALLRTMKEFRERSSRDLFQRRERRAAKLKPMLELEPNEHSDSPAHNDSGGGGGGGGEKSNAKSIPTANQNANPNANSNANQNSNANANANQNPFRGNPKLLAKLNCKLWNVSDEAAQEMVYWRDIPTDSAYSPPFFAINRQPGNERKYMTFEPDGGGWNNIRMAMESTIAMAVATGRTLVMPPQKRMYLLGDTKDGQRHHFNFVDFFPIERMAADNVAFEVVSMQEYLEAEAMTGKLINKETGKVEFPPGNRTDWNGINQEDYDTLRYYLRSVSHTLDWKPGKCLPAFPSSGNHKDVEILQSLVKEVREMKESKSDKLFQVDDPDPRARLQDTLSGRRALCVYDEEDQNEKVVHFQMNHKKGLRLLVHFYAFLFFEDWREDMWMKRVIRDHLYYSDEIQCAAAKVVDKVRDHVSKVTNGKTREFISFHIRRGDFQFEDTRIGIEDIMANTQDLIPSGSVIFIATDERNLKFFDPMRKKYDLLFLKDFKDDLKGVNSNYFGMIDQLVASRGSKFFGCWHSTFTGYIMRLRGYHSIKDKSEGYEQGILPTTYYYTPKNLQTEMHTYSPIRGAFFNREFPTSWRAIDTGVEELAAIARHKR
mmetsp:Transcript_20688/g.57448  ORF Transcript_20688/g.57448 Transcript_20688/m.57448 type:complete len:678 (-) Transcript_20688:278-2311(-)